MMLRLQVQHHDVAGNYFNPDICEEVRKGYKPIGVQAGRSGTLPCVLSVLSICLPLALIAYLVLV